MHEFHISKEQSGVRLDHFLSAKIPALSRSRIQNLIKLGFVRVNDCAEKSSTKIKSGDAITLHEPSAEPCKTEAEVIPLEILFEDDDLLVIDKPAGMVVHPAVGNRSKTLVNALLNHCKTLSGIGGEQRPGIVHRLDKETSGCIVVAKNDFAHQHLSQQFAARKVSKIYLALVNGHLKRKAGEIENAIGRHPVHRQKMAVVESARGRISKTEFRVVKELPGASLVECTLHTGRTHQIRVHFKHLGHPLLGDKLYGTKTGAEFSRQMLHAWKLGFFHPRSEKWMQFESPIPHDFSVIAGEKMISQAAPDLFRRTRND